MSGQDELNHELWLATRVGNMVAWDYPLYTARKIFPKAI